MSDLYLSDLQRDALISALEDEIHASKFRLANKECADVEVETKHLDAIREVLDGMMTQGA